MNDMQIVTFRLSDNDYGLEIMKVREIMKMVPMTQVPSADRCLCGMINVRGDVIPVINTQMKLGMGRGEVNPESRLLLVEKEGKTAGLLVDEVLEVLAVPGSQVEPIENLEVVASGIRGIIGVAKVGNDLLTILNTDELL
ncbi:MAG: purine-binding chemotaxis protein CheW [Firmicutes bacterium]|nr:purine-binding chemotaxis protein CheW [Bacillota bacterium]